MIALINIINICVNTKTTELWSPTAVIYWRLVKNEYYIH